ERALLDRATDAPGLPGLFIPQPEDHAILIAIHAATHDFEHAPALLDTELLLRRGLDLAALAARARAYRAGPVMLVPLRALRALGAASVTDAHVAAFDPGPLRRALLDRRRARGGSDQALGLPWVVRQTPLRDDLGGWTLGILRYAALRGVERLL